jgi:hypothetical protein
MVLTKLQKHAVDSMAVRIRIANYCAEAENGIAALVTTAA